MPKSHWPRVIGMTRPPKGDHNDATEHALSTEQASRQFWYLKFNGPRANPILQSIHIGGCTLGRAEIMVFARFGNFSCEYPLELRFTQLIFCGFSKRCIVHHSYMFSHDTTAAEKLHNWPLQWCPASRNIFLK